MKDAVWYHTPLLHIWPHCVTSINKWPLETFMLICGPFNWPLIMFTLNRLTLNFIWFTFDVEVQIFTISYLFTDIRIVVITFQNWTSVPLHCFRYVLVCVNYYTYPKLVENDHSNWLYLQSVFMFCLRIVTENKSRWEYPDPVEHLHNLVS